MSHLLLFLGNLDGPQVLLELPLVDPVFILDILQGDLGLLLKLCQLIEVLENKMLAPLLVDLDLNLVPLAEILLFSLLVPELGLLVFQLFLADEPEVVDSQTLVVIQTGELLLVLDGLFKGTVLDSESLFVVLIIDISDSLGLLFRLFFCACSTLGGWFGSHIKNFF